MGVYLQIKDYSAMQGPSPDGFHIPSKDEWDNIYTAYTGLGLSGGTDFSTYLKLPLAGSRLYNNLNYSNRGLSGNYWTVNSAASNTAKYFLFDTSNIFIDNNTYRSYGYSIRSIKDTPVIPDNNWTTLYAGTGDAGIFHDTTNGLISISSNGTTWYTIADKNLGATTVYNYGDTLSENNCGKVYQRGNNYGFSGDANYDTSQITKSSTKVDVTGYGPGNYYSSSTWITVNPRQNSTNDGYNLRGGVTGVKPMSELKNAYIGEYREWKPGANTIAYYPLTSETTVNDQSGNNRNLTNYNGVAFGTYAGVDCSYFSGNKMILYHSDFPARGYGNYTISCWMYTTSNNQQIVLSHGNADATGLVILIRNGYIDPNIAPVSLNAWHNIAYIIESGYLKMYVDGVLVYNNTYNVNGGKSLGIGRKTYMDDMNYLGYISEVIMESAAWSAQEILNYYNSTKANYGL